jgi:HEAT repeat protein
LVTGLARADDISRLVKDLRSTKEATRRSACHGLGNRGPTAKKAGPALVRALGDQKSSVRSAAQGALIKIGPDCFKAVLGGTRSSDSRVVHGAADVIKAYTRVMPPEKTRPFIPTFINWLRSRHYSLRQAAPECLAASGWNAVPPLLRALGHKDERVRKGAIDALVRIGPPVQDPLLQALGSEKPLIRAAAAACLGQGEFDKTAVSGPLIALLKDPEESVRGAAATALGSVRAKAGIAPLINALNDTEAVSEAARAALDWPAATGEVARRLGTGSARQQAAFEVILVRRGKGAIGDLGKTLQNGAVAGRRVAIRILERITEQHVTEAAARAVERALEDEDREVRIVALRVIGRFSGKWVAASKPVLLRAAQDETDPGMLRAALASLGHLGWSDAGTKAAVFKAMASKDGETRAAAALAIWATGIEPKHGLALLKALLTTTKRPPNERAAAARALGETGANARDVLPALHEIATVAETNAELRVAAIEAAGRILAAGGGIYDGRAERYKRLHSGPRGAAERGLAWLRTTQEKSGEWRPDRFGGRALHRAGVSGLALLALMAPGPQAASDANIRKGLKALLEMQAADGVLGTRAVNDFIVSHGIATQALAEGYALTGDPAARRGAILGVRFIERARNPYLAWRYVPRGGENDTHCTTWMVCALKAAGWAGIAIDPDAYEGARQWIDKLTDPEFGQTGYNMPGGGASRPQGQHDRFPPEKTQSMTASGVWIRQMLGEGGADITRKGYALMDHTRPEWDPDAGCIDLYYWNFGALAFAQAPTRAKKWTAALDLALTSGQVADGAWPAIGVWGNDGGRVYSTAMATLALLARVRFPEGGVDKPLPSAFDANAKAMLKALGDLEKDADKRVAAAASEAQRRIWVR